MTPLADAGRVIAGRYRLEAPIGRGAMGIVWRARDLLLDRDVAVKEVQMADTLTADERANAYQRTLREAKTAARLSHPGVVSVYDVADDDGRPWIVMELVNARSLDQVLAVEGPLSPRQTAEIGRQLLAALTVAHSAGVLHRDVKPSNVLLSQEGRAVLTDFGIATFQGDPKLTQTGMVMGSPGFTAPERIRGGDATPASDLWSLGATLYAAVQGHGPYESRGGAITTMSAIINEDAPAAPAAGALSPVIEALLRREPTARPDAATASRMISDVLPLLSDRPGAGGYEPTALSAASPGEPAVGAARTSMDAVADKSAAPDAYGGAQVGWGLPAASVAPATKPQPSLNDAPRPAGGLAGGSSNLSGSGSPAQAPDFSSWYASQPPPQRDVAAWPQTPPGSGSQDGQRELTYQPDQGRQRKPGGIGRRWLLALIALAVVGAGAGVTTVLLLRNNGNTGNAGATSTIGGPSGTPQGTVNAGSGGYAVMSIAQAINRPSTGPFPAGFVEHTVPASSFSGAAAGFGLSYPNSWSVQTSGPETRFKYPPQLNAYVLVDLTPHTFPADMLREARYIKAQSASAHPGYRQIGVIGALPIRGSIGSYWKFTYDDDGVTQEVLDLLWIAKTPAGLQSYAMYFTAPKSEWAKLRPVFATIAESFAPATG